MTPSPALDLLLRVAAERLRGETCPGCGVALTDAKIRPQAQAAERFTVAVTCPGCARELRVDLEPEG